MAAGVSRIRSFCCYLPPSTRFLHKFGSRRRGNVNGVRVLIFINDADGCCCVGDSHGLPLTVWESEGRINDAQTRFASAQTESLIHAGSSSSPEDPRDRTSEGACQLSPPEVPTVAPRCCGNRRLCGDLAGLCQHDPQCCSVVTLSSGVL